MKLVRTALAHDVDYAAHRARVFGFEAGGLDLDFAEEFELDRVVVSERATANVGNFNAVNYEGVFRAARAVDLETTDAEVTGLGFGAYARGHDKDGVEVPALRRVFNKFLGDVGSGLARGNVDRFGTGVTVTDSVTPPAESATSTFDAWPRMTFTSSFLTVLKPGWLTVTV